jgi:hypothetical protein
MSRAAHSWALGRQGRGYRLKIVWGQSGSLRDSGEHDRANFLIIVEREDEVGPPFARERAVGAGLSLWFPPDSQQRREDSPRLGRWPVAHAAWKVTFRSSPGAS